MSFFNIAPRDVNYLEYQVEGLSLKVIQGDGVDATPDIRINQTELNKGYTQYWNGTGNGLEFKVNVIIKSDETVDAKSAVALDNWYVIDMKTGIQTPKNPTWIYDGETVKVLDILDYWIRNMIPLMVTTEAIDVKNGLYIITENGSRKQTYEDYTVWSLTFRKYESIPKVVFKGSTAGVEKAKKNYNTAKAQKKKVATKKTNAQKLYACDIGVLKYSKKKKVVTCVKYLQAVLINKKCLANKKENKDGWFGKETLKAVKKFQKDNKKYGLNQDGKINQATLNCLCGKCGQIGKTKTIKSTNPLPKVTPVKSGDPVVPAIPSNTITPNLPPSTVIVK
ncbi:peptidoglycan-binding domain-containing protein [Methanobrevibacter sp.]